MKYEVSDYVTLLASLLLLWWLAMLTPMSRRLNTDTKELSWELWSRAGYLMVILIVIEILGRHYGFTS